MKLEKGLIQVYTGNGKGKTTAALGQGLRAVGQGLKVCLIQFLKPVEVYSGEVGAVSRLGPDFHLLKFDLVHPSFARDKLEAEKKLRGELPKILQRVEEIVKSGQYDMVILDEINNLLSQGFVSLDWALQLIRNRPPQVELILTGRGAPEELIAAADLVTEMVEIKHPYQKGIKMRKGIEY